MRIGVDLGGTKIEVIALDDGGRTLLRRRVPTPVGDYDGTLNAVAELVLSAEKELGKAATVGVATPGAISPKTDMIKNSNSTALNGKPLDRDLASRLARPVRLENDANCFALSEAVDGAGADARVVFGVILGTGVGGGIVIDKQLLVGRNWIAGEWGHNPLPWVGDSERPGAPCYCGKAGCVETFLSGGGLVREYVAHTGLRASAEDIALAASAGNQQARACVGAYRDRLARSLAAVINLIDPDAVVLGGGLSNIPLLYDALPALVARHAFSESIDTPIVQAKHGDSSGVRGAAWLWPMDAK
ncbi:MAG TPA: ROK family protein [Xanthobacteraceae bacterium]|jgi:fructokinase